MKIGIVTQPLHSNYGGLLQAFALQQVLKRMGHDVKTIDWANDLSYVRWFFSCCASLLRGLKAGSFSFPMLPFKVKYMRCHTDKFIKEHIETTHSMRHIKEKELLRYGFDTYVVGSDQVWRLEYNRFIEWMYLSFVTKPAVRLAYAASIGIDTWNYPEHKTIQCAELIQKFQGISVREKDAVPLIKKHLGVSAEYVLDPTLMLDASDYVQILGLPDVKANKSIAVYVLDITEEKRKLFSDLQEKLQCAIKYLGNPNAQNEQFKYTERQSPTVEDWLNGIRQADYVLTDSFHGTVFSIIFHKPFVCLDNSGRGSSRFKSLLETMGLESRKIGFNMYSPVVAAQIADCLQSSVNWENVDREKRKMQQSSISFLKQNL